MFNMGKIKVCKILCDATARLKQANTVFNTPNRHTLPNTSSDTTFEQQHNEAMAIAGGSQPKWPSLASLGKRIGGHTLARVALGPQLTSNESH